MVWNPRELKTAGVGPTRYCDEHFGGGLRVVPKRGRDGDASVLHQGCVADDNGCAVSQGRNTPARRVVETLRLPDRPAQRLDIRNDSLAERMLGAQFRGCGRVEDSEWATIRPERSLNTVAYGE